MRRGLAAALCAAPALAAAVAAAPARAETVVTVPPVKGVALQSGANRTTTNARGRGQLELVGAFGGGNVTASGVLRVAKTRIGRHGEARLNRIYVRHTGRAGASVRRPVVTLSTFWKVRFAFQDLQGREIDPAAIDSVTIKSSTGIVRTLKPGATVELQGSRVVSPGGRLQSKPIRWSLQSVKADGSNVVNESEQRFLAQKRPVVRAQLLYYAARFKAHDALFGFALGKSVELTRPDGEVSKVPFGADKEVAIGPVPRGEYNVRVRAPGYSPPRPIALSRDQVVDLQVISWLDLIVVFGTLGVFALFLLTVRRPKLRARLAWPVRALRGRRVRRAGAAPNVPGRENPS